MHINRKHTKYDENVTSFQCENCKGFRSAGEFKEHMISHSYRQLKFKCDECDFWGPNKQTIKCIAEEFILKLLHVEWVILK